MSEEKLVVTGRCAEISERGEWTTFHIDVGRQYPVKLSTKLQPLIELGRAASKAGAEMDWTYSESEGAENPHRPGTRYTNRYLSGVEPAGSVATPAAAPRDSGVNTGHPPSTLRAGSDGMTKEEWARKDSAIHMMAAIKAAADALKHTLPSDPTPEDLARYLDRCKTLSYNWWQRAEAVRKGDDSDIPFLSQHDDGIPY